jgi:acyl-CoA thioester hydrolase
MGRTYRHSLRVRYSECDLQGHVFNANYFSYFDIALTELWRVAAGGYEEMLDSGVDLVVVEATARFRAPARFADELVVELTVSHLGTTSMRTELRVLRDDVPLVEGQMVHVFIQRATTTKVPIPPPIRTALEAPGAEAAGADAGSQVNAAANVAPSTTTPTTSQVT